MSCNMYRTVESDCENTDRQINADRGLVWYIAGGYKSLCNNKM